MVGIGAAGAVGRNRSPATTASRIRELAAMSSVANLSHMSADPTRWSPTAVRILRATAELIAKQGYSATSTRDIAAAVGVEQPAIYKHFSAKSDIFAALVRLALQWPVEFAE